jgi:hypothetical protein
MGAYSDDELSRDSQSLSSRGSSSRHTEGQYAAFTDVMCGAIFTTPQTGERPYVCFRAATCRRTNHKDLPRCTLVGYLFSLKKTNKKYYDGVLESSTSPTVFQGRQQEVVASNRSALRSYAANQSVTVTRSQSSTTPSSHSRQSNTGPNATTGTPGDTSYHSMTLAQLKTAPTPMGNRVQVQFSSPAAETFPHPRAPPMQSESDEGLSASQWARALEIARQEVQLTARGSEKAPAEANQAKVSKSTSGRKSRKSSSRSRSGRSTKGKSGRKKKGSYSSSSSSDSETNTDSEPESDPSSASDGSRAPSFWYAVALGLKGRYLVTPVKREAKALVVPGCHYRRCHTEDEAWEFVDRYRDNNATSSPRESRGLLPTIAESHTPPSASLPPVVTPETGRTQGPGVPPLLLSGRDKSAKIEDEIFGISLDMDVIALQGKLAPPGVTPTVAKDLAECLLDAVSLPGKTGQSTESEDTVANLQISLEEIGRISRQEQLGDVQRRDLKWSQLSRNVLKSVKNDEDLRTMMIDVLSLKDRTISTLIAWQKSILSKEPWESVLCEAWSGGGYFTVLSRKSLDHYISLLEHLLALSGKYPWDMVQQEIDYYVQKWVLVRNNSQSRLMAMCRIYVILRDGAAHDWITPKLEAKKLLKLYQDLTTTITQMGSGVGAIRPQGPHITGCTHCGTILHGGGVCAWASASTGKAKEKGRVALRALGAGSRPITPAEAAGNQEG